MADTYAARMAREGFRLSLLLNAVGCEVASAGIEIHSIAKAVSLFSVVLKQAGEKCQNPGPIPSTEAIETIQEIAGSCQRAFDEIERMLDRARIDAIHGDGGHEFLQQRFRETFKKHRVTYLLAYLETLKLSLIVVFEILRLAEVMEATRGDQSRPSNAEAVLQERAEIQNMVVVRYWSMNRLDRLYDLADREAEEDERVYMQKSSGRTKETAPPVQSPVPAALKKLPVVSLGELNRALTPIKESPKDMVRVSASVIDPLLSQWTTISIKYGTERNVKEYERGRYTPQVHDVSDSEDGRWRDSGGREVKGYYLEGSTEDWRKPHSQEARAQAIERRQKYSAYQPRVDTDSDDSESEKARHRRQKSRGSSSSYSDKGSSESDESWPSQSRTTDSAKTKKKLRFEEPLKKSHVPSPPSSPGGRSAQHSYSPTSPGSHSIPIPPGRSQSGNRSPLGGSPQAQTNDAYPYPNPQYGTPIPIPQGRSQSGNRSPLGGSPQTQTNDAYPYPNPQYGTPTSKHPSYLSAHWTPQQSGPRTSSPRTPERPRLERTHSSSHYHGRSPPRSDYRRDDERDKYRDYKKGATKGLLGAGAIAGFLEAIEGLVL